MRRSLTLTFSVALAALAPVRAQVVDTLGSTANPATTGQAKANLFAVDSSVLVIEMEWYLSIPGADTLTFFCYRHHSRTGSATLEWTLPVAVTGGGGPAWYSTGPIALELAAGNHYALGVAFNSTLTYYFSVANGGAPVSFGSWQRGHTPQNPLPPTLSLTGFDGAQYYQRITTFPVTSVVPVGAPCASPRLVAAGFYSINASQTLELVGGSPSAFAVFALAVGPALPSPLPVFGCDLWLDLSQFATGGTFTDPSGYASLTLAVPNTPSLVGSTYTAQALDLGGPATLTNAVQFTIQ